MNDLKAGDMVYVGDQECPYVVVNPIPEGVPPNVGGMTLVARWYRTELLRKVEQQ